MKKEFDYMIPEYNLSDVFVPLKSLRHLPKICKLEDEILQTSEIAMLSIINMANIWFYYPIVEKLLQ